MRIISGEARGRTLYAPNGDQTRPTSDKIRGSLFNIMNGRTEGARVLDLFGGTGALALEALSRGADFAVIADSAKPAYEAIRRNAANVLGDAQDARAKLLKADYRQTVAAVSDMRFDLVFLDPPYRMTEVYADAIRRLDAAGMLAEDALIVAERRGTVPVEYPEGFEICDTRAYGETSVDFVRRRD